MSDNDDDQSPENAVNNMDEETRQGIADGTIPVSGSDADKIKKAAQKAVGKKKRGNSIWN